MGDSLPIEGPGTLGQTEPHPSTESAVNFVGDIGMERLHRYLEAYASTAIEGNRLGAICSETLRRLLAQEPVSDRYLLGLAWSLRNLEEAR